MALAAETYQYLVFKNPNWDYLTFDPARDIALADKVAGPTMNSVDPNLKPFFKHGGKLLMYHGWADPGIAPENSVNYFTQRRRCDGREIESLQFDSPVHGSRHGALRAAATAPTISTKSARWRTWVETDQPPDRILAAHKTKGVVDRTRPLCPYPETAHYKGSGNTDDAANFVCAERGNSNASGSKRVHDHSRITLPALPLLHHLKRLLVIADRETGA